MLLGIRNLSKSKSVKDKNSLLLNFVFSCYSYASYKKMVKSICDLISVLKMYKTDILKGI